MNMSCVTSKLHIENIRGCDLVSLLTSLKCTVGYLEAESGEGGDPGPGAGHGVWCGGGDAGRRVDTGQWPGSVQDGGASLAWWSGQIQRRAAGLGKKQNLESVFGRRFELYCQKKRE